jgi:hypothetical protein
MRNVIQYFDLVGRTIEFSAAVSAELDLEQLDHARGTVDGKIYFADRSRLEFTERIAIERAARSSEIIAINMCVPARLYFVTIMRRIIQASRRSPTTSTSDEKHYPPVNQL